jgi:pimeloyl-ACP methyl ester carboxylesterase
MSRLLSVLAAALSVVAIVVSTRSQTFTYVKIDGRTLRMLVTGNGQSTVVFENGLGPPLETWGKVQPAVSRFARTVAYDRAGVGVSDEGPAPRDGRHVADDLHAALRLASVPPPYILVGHSLGGPFVRIYAGVYPDDVAGLVLVDPAPDSEEIGDDVELPEAKASRDTFTQARASRVGAGIPVFLIDALGPLDVPFATETIRALRMRGRAENEAEHLEYMNWLDTIPDSRLIVTRRSGHNIPIEQPDLVIETIRQMAERTSPGLKPISALWRTLEP